MADSGRSLSLRERALVSHYAATTTVATPDWHRMTATATRDPGPRAGLGSRTSGGCQLSAVSPGEQRCSEKGCIFPVARHTTGKCLYHDREQREPALFHSLQPSMLLLDRAKFGLPDPKGDDSRARDRRRLAALREQCLEEAA